MTPADRVIVEAFSRWLAGERTVWDDDGRLIIDLDEIGKQKEVPCQSTRQHTT